jgi:hypothetical protein
LRFITLPVVRWKDRSNRPFALLFRAHAHQRLPLPRFDVWDSHQQPFENRSAGVNAGLLLERIESECHFSPEEDRPSFHYRQANQAPDEIFWTGLNSEQEFRARFTAYSWLGAVEEGGQMVSEMKPSSTSPPAYNQ